MSAETVTISTSEIGRGVSPGGDYPNLKGVAEKGDIEQVRAGSYSADYLNWARTMQLLRDNAPGWLPELVATAEGGYVHPAGVGGFLLIRFRHADGRETPAAPQAIMDNRNAAIPLDKITARDVTDTHRRGLCMAAALTFGLAYELWAKMPLESGYDDSQASAPQPPASTPATGGPLSHKQPGEGAEDSPRDDRLAAVIARLTKLDPSTQYAAALEDDARKTYREPGGLVALTPEQREHMAGRLEAHAEKFEAALAANKSADGAATSAGVETTPVSPVPSAESSAGEAAGTDGASEVGATEPPAESLFKAPTSERGAKRKAAA